MRRAHPKGKFCGCVLRRRRVAGIRATTGQGRRPGRPQAAQAAIRATAAARRTGGAHGRAPGATPAAAA